MREQSYALALTVLVALMLPLFPSLTDESLQERNSASYSSIRSTSCLIQVCINEMMPNANGSDQGIFPNGEWVELYNLGSSYVNLQGWTLEDLGGWVHPINADTWVGFSDLPTPFVLTPGHHAIIAENEIGTLRLNNAGETLYLKDSNGSVVHTVTTGEASQGVSKVPTWDTSSEWIDSDYPTPGTSNPQQFPDSDSDAIPDNFDNCPDSDLIWSSNTMKSILTFYGNPNPGDTINITSGHFQLLNESGGVPFAPNWDSRTLMYTAVSGASDFENRQFSVQGGPDYAAIELKKAIEHVNGHGSQYARNVGLNISADYVDGVLTLSQPLRHMYGSVIITATELENLWRLYGIVSHLDGVAITNFTTSDWDRDGCNDDVEDYDDDADGLNDTVDQCPLSNWLSLGTNLLRPQYTLWADYDNDGCMAVNSFWHENLNEDLDQDNDGISDIQERFGTIGEGFASCWVGELNWTSNITNDYDQDGCRDATEDLDDDNDGFTDSDEMENCGEGNDPLDEDDYPSNNDEDWGDLWISWSRYGYEEWYSLAFRLCDYLDPDDDNDGFVDSTELECNSDPMYSISQPVDTDGDTVCDPQDYDDDGDGYLDSNDDFPLNDSEWLDTDNDGIGDNSDVDVDGDGWTNSEEERCGTNPMVYSDAPLDTDADRICDMFDDDDDNDGVGDLNDVFPLDWAEWADNDMDGIGDNADSDDDNDGFPDNIDNWPFNPCISTDSDSDGLPDFLMLNCEGVEDFDDDDDLVLDVNDFCSPGEVGWISGAAIGTDYDGDGCRDDGEDTDDDNDGVEDSNDQCPRGHTGWISNPINDIDGDGCHESEDFDRDGDGVGDIEDAFPDDPTEWADSDGDGVGDNSDSGDTADKGNYNLAIMVFLSLTAVVVIVWKMKSS